MHVLLLVDRSRSDDKTWKTLENKFIEFNLSSCSQEQDRIIVESKKREREYNLLFRNSLFYVYDGGSRLRILQHCHEMPLVGYFRDFGISFSKLLVAFIGLMLVVGQSVLDIHHMGYSNSYQYPIVQGSLSLW